MMERIAATVHPIGHADQIPTEPKAVLESTIANPTLKIKSVNVAIILSKTVLGPFGIWSAWPIGWTVAAILSIMFYRSGKWNQQFQNTNRLEMLDS